MKRSERDLRQWLRRCVSEDADRCATVNDVHRWAANVVGASLTLLLVGRGHPAAGVVGESIRVTVGDRTRGPFELVAEYLARWQAAR